jgi:hypothetical protein
MPYNTYLSQEEKHVGFIVDSEAEEERQEIEPEEKQNLKLHRRDTPHHLKNKRIVPEVVDSDAIRAILQRVSIISVDLVLQV